MTHSDQPSEPKKPWDQMDGEPDKWFARFLVFLGLGTKRSLKLAQIAAEQGTKKGRKELRQRAGSWTECCEKWAWHDRANKYDIFQAQKGLQTLEQSMDEQRRETAAFARDYARMMNRCLNAKNMEDVRLELGKIMALSRKSGGIDGLAMLHKTSFGDKHKIEGGKAIEIDWDAPFERHVKKS